MFPDLHRAYRASNTSNGLTNQAKTNESPLERQAENRRRDKNEHIDMYKRSGLVVDSIEEQIRQQEAKIKEIDRNLALLRDEYYEKTEEKKEAVRQRYQKEISQKESESNKNILQRTIKKIMKKYINGEQLSNIENHYLLNPEIYTKSEEDLKTAEENYKKAKENASEAISNYHSSNCNFTSGIWKKEDAIWDLAKLKRNIFFIETLS